MIDELIIDPIPVKPLIVKAMGYNFINFQQNPQALVENWQLILWNRFKTHNAHSNYTFVKNIIEEHKQQLIRWVSFEYQLEESAAEKKLDAYSDTITAFDTTESAFKYGKPDVYNCIHVVKGPLLSVLLFIPPTIENTWCRIGDLIDNAEEILPRPVDLPRLKTLPAGFIPQATHFIRFKNYENTDKPLCMDGVTYLKQLFSYRENHIDFSDETTVDYIENYRHRFIVQFLIFLTFIQDLFTEPDKDKLREQFVPAVVTYRIC